MRTVAENPDRSHLKGQLSTIILGDPAARNKPIKEDRGIIAPSTQFITASSAINHRGESEEN